jgi:AraC family transcriptional regulator
MAQPVSLDQFVGPPLHTQGGGGIVVHEGTFAADQTIVPHVHDVPVISLILRGAGTETVSEGARELASQDLILTPAYALHAYKFREAGRWLNMQFSDAWLERVTDGHPILSKRSQVIESRSAAAWATRVRTEVQRNDSVSALAIDGAMMLMMAEITRTQIDGARARPRWLRSVEDAIAVSVAEAPSVEELAKIAGVHPTHLLRTFRRYHGITIANFVRKQRIERARAEVALGKRPLAMIALDAGFADQSHFTRVFRQAFGETPGQFARSLKRR